MGSKYDEIDGGVIATAFQSIMQWPPPSPPSFWRYCHADDTDNYFRLLLIVSSYIADRIRDEDADV